jgi:transcriptional regulator with XRE-family HTH domain
MNVKQQNIIFFSKQFYKAIKEKNFERKTNKELSVIFDVSPMTIHRWLSGKMMPSMARIPHIAKILGVSVEYLVADNFDNEVICDSDKDFFNQYKNLSAHKKQILRDIIIAFNDK